MSLPLLVIPFLMNFALAKSDISSNIEAILKGLKDYKSNLSIYVAKSPSHFIYRNQEDKLLVPASISKLVTGIVVLNELGPATRLSTRIEAPKGQIKNGRLSGDICLIGSGDPSFVSENMWILVNNFLRSGIKTITGDVIVDDSLFDQVAFDESRLKNRVNRAYDAPVGAMSFNWNSINVYVAPSESGKKAQVTLDPSNEYSILENHVISNSKPTQISVSKVKQGALDKVVVRGNIKLGSPEVLYFVPVTSPALWSGYNLKSFLEQRGVKLEGMVKNIKCPFKGYQVASSESKPVEQMVKDMNKFSNNFVAEMLIKLLASQKKAMASLQDGVADIQAFLKRRGYSEKEIHLTNPSGLTRDNKTTARAMWRLLYESHGDLSLNGELVSSLPLAGIDGTLKNRMKDQDTVGRVRAKTGYLNGVVSLAGYYANKDQDIIPFVFIYNGSEDEAKVRNLFDRVVTFLVKQ